MSEQIQLTECRKADILTTDGTIPQKICEAQVQYLPDGPVLIIVPRQYFAEARNRTQTFNCQICFYDARRGLMYYECRLSHPHNLKDNQCGWECMAVRKVRVAQRREECKVAVSLEATAALTEVRRSLFPVLFKVAVKNLSAGGIYFVCKEYLEPGTGITLHLAEDLEWELPATVLRREECEPYGGCRMYGYGCQFDDLPAVQKSDIRRYVYALQASQREKAVG